MRLITKDEFVKWYWNEMDKLNHLEDEKEKYEMMEEMGEKLMDAIDAFSAIDRGEAVITIPVQKFLERINGFKKATDSTETKSVKDVMREWCFDVLIKTFIPKEYWSIIR